MVDYNSNRETTSGVDQGKQATSMADNASSEPSTSARTPAASSAPFAPSASASAPMAQRKYTFLKPAGTPTPLRELFQSRSKVVDMNQLAADLPDSYFEPTVGELARVHAGQVKQRERYEGPLLTRKLRDEAASKEAAAKRARFPNTRIRVKFADRSQLETTFTSASRLPAVYGAIREALLDEYKAVKFVLYQTPPMRRYEPEDPNLTGKSLYDLQLAPASVFYIMFANTALNDPSRAPPLRLELLSAAEDIPPPPTFDEAALTKEPAKKAATSTSDDAVSRTKSGTAIPKWLKTGKSGHK